MQIQHQPEKDTLLKISLFFKLISFSAADMIFINNCNLISQPFDIPNLQENSHTVYQTTCWMSAEMLECCSRVSGLQMKAWELNALHLLSSTILDSTCPYIAYQSQPWSLAKNKIPLSTLIYSLTTLIGLRIPCPKFCSWASSKEASKCAWEVSSET